MGKGYIRGELKSELHETHHHVLPLSMYMKVFGALMVLTVVTVLVSEMNLGAASLPVAMFVALVKAGLVVGFFMHLKYDTRFHSFIFFSTILFVGIFFALTFFDLNTRGQMQKEWDNHVVARDKGEFEKPAPVKSEDQGAHGGEHGGEAGEIKAPEPGEAGEIKAPEPGEAGGH